MSGYVNKKILVWNIENDQLFAEFECVKSIKSIHDDKYMIALDEMVHANDLLEKIKISCFSSYPIEKIRVASDSIILFSTTIY